MKHSTLTAIFVAVLALLASTACLAQEQSGVVSAKTLNLRSTPIIQPDNIVGHLVEGDEVTVLEQADEWLKVRAADGSTGWVAAVYINRGGAGLDPKHLLATAESVFEHSYTVNKMTTKTGVEEYKEYNVARVAEAHDLVQKVIASPGFDDMPRALLLRGRCRTIIGWYSLSATAEKFLKSAKSEFTYNELGDNYAYNGGDFKEILKKYPKSELVDAAAFEIANLPHVGECEGDPACIFDRELTPFEPFLKKYSESPYAARAIELINSMSMDYWLDESGGAPAIKSDYQDMDKAVMVKLLDRYSAAVSGMKNCDKANALHAIGDAYLAFGKKDSAAAAYKKILADCPAYEAAAHVKKELDGLK